MSEAAWLYTAGKTTSCDEGRFSRTRNVLGEDSDAILAGKTVAVFGLGGVGSFAVEALARAGIGRFVLVDSDSVAESNLNRQLFALHSTLGKKKTEVAAARIMDINPDARVETFCLFYPQDADPERPVDLRDCSFAVDCIDSVPSKVALVLNAKAAGIPLISCMGTGNKTNPLLFRFADIYETSVCPLARVMRHELRKKNVESQKVLFSTERPVVARRAKAKENEIGLGAGNVVGSVPFVPSVAGLLLAGEIIRELLQRDEHKNVSASGKTI